MAKKIVAKKALAVKPTVKSKAKIVPKAKVVKATVKPAPVKPAFASKGFSKTELAHFKALMLEKRKEILEELETLKASMMDVQTGEYVTENSTYSLHMEQGTDTMEREKTFLFASREGKFLNYLDDALKRLEKGEYGFCLDCSSLIDKERLEAVPHAQLCIKCKLKRGR